MPEASQGVQAWDRYAYVNNNPVNFNGPSGHEPPEHYCYNPTDKSCFVDPYDEDGDGIPDQPKPDEEPVDIGTKPGCTSTSYTECFYNRELLEIDGQMNVDPKQFELLTIAVYYDVHNRDRTIKDRMNYDTPFWDYYGETPGEVCFSGLCYERHEVNYFAQGMWAAAQGETLEQGVNAVITWKTFNWGIYNLRGDSQTYPNRTPSDGTIYFFEYGYNIYNTYSIKYSDFFTANP